MCFGSIAANAFWLNARHYMAHQRIVSPCRTQLPNAMSISINDQLIDDKRCQAVVVLPDLWSSMCTNKYIYTQMMAHANATWRRLCTVCCSGNYYIRRLCKTQSINSYCVELSRVTWIHSQTTGETDHSARARLKVINVDGVSRGVINDKRVRPICIGRVLVCVWQTPPRYSITLD